VTPEGVAKDFVPELPAAQAKVLPTQGPIFAKAFDGKVTNAASKNKPSWFVFLRDATRQRQFDGLSN